MSENTGIMDHAIGLTKSLLNLTTVDNTTLGHVTFLLVTGAIGVTNLLNSDESPLHQNTDLSNSRKLLMLVGVSELKGLIYGFFAPVTIPVLTAQFLYGCDMTGHLVPGHSLYQKRDDSVWNFIRPSHQA